METVYDEKRGEYICRAKPLVSVTNVEAKSDYTLILTFSTGEIKKFDMKPLLDFKPNRHLKKPALFKNVKIECGGVTWDDDTDIDPEGLYRESISVNPCAPI